MPTIYKRFAFYTLGCRANQFQTEALKARLLPEKYRCVDFKETADVYVINTCCVTLDAERKSRQAIRRALRQNPKARVMIAGCLAKVEKAALLKLFPSLEFLTLDALASFARPLPPKVRANLMIQDGCEQHCSYCVVPLTRGKVRIKPLPQILEEAERLVAAGAREIILTGINLGTYPNLSAVLLLLAKIKALCRIRLSSLEPMYITPELIDCIATTPKVCPYLHIPLQSGDNRILEAMRRKYTGSEYLKIVRYVREKMPDCGLSTDIIVGFPGEGEREFKNTLKLVEAASFSRIHIFNYSKRKNTPAAEFPHQILPEVKQERHALLQKLGTKHRVEFARQYLNQKIEILVEQRGEGLTANYIRCFFNDPQDSSGKLKKLFACSVNAKGGITA